MSIDKLVSRIKYLGRKALIIPLLTAGLVGYSCSNGTPAGRLAETDVGYVSDAGYISDVQNDGSFNDGGIVDAGVDAVPYEELKVRINFLEFSTDHSSAAGDDYLFDVEIKSEEKEGCYAQARTGHSRFIQPEYLDLSLPVACSGELTRVKIFGYWHLSDILIDIDPESSHGHCLQTSIINPEGPEGCYLSLDYTIGSILEGEVDGNNDGFLVDPFDGLLKYKIETLF